MSTPEEQPSSQEALARAHAARAEIAAALDEDQEPEPAEPLGWQPVWQPVWKRPRKPMSKEDKKQELRKQRRRLQDAGRRRFVAGQSRRPRSRQSRIGNVAGRRYARALSWMRHSNTWLW